MSLRAEIRDAIDDVIPPAPMLERTVTAFVLADVANRRVLPRRRRRSPWGFRVRGTAAAIAAVLVVVLIGSLILGGRFLRDRGGSPSPAINQNELKRLEARPLAVMPAMPSGQCPIGPMATDYIGGPAIGDGDVRTVLGNPSVLNTDWGSWSLTYFIVRPNDSGLFLVRAWDLQSRQPVFFAGNISGVADAQMGRAILAGDIAGQVKVNGETVPLRPELVINASAPSDWDKSAGQAPGWSAFVGIPKGFTGCIFFQVDHGDTTETLVRAY
jgi:hypothetical protein